MSYSIYIGEPTIEYYPEDNWMKIKVQQVSHDDAPDLGYGDISGKTNGRHPGYSQMSNFCRRAGLYNLFFDEEEGLLRVHPGCVPITEKHLDTIRKARISWEKGYPNCKELMPNAKNEPKDRKYSWSELDDISKDLDWTYGRLVWYEFWFDWALKNCEMPSIENY